LTLGPARPGCLVWECERKRVMKPKRRPKTKPSKKGGKAALKAPRRKTAGKTPRAARGERPRKGARSAGATAGGRHGGERGKRVAGPRPVLRHAARPRPVPMSPRVERLKAMLESKQAEILKQIKRARAESLDVDRTSFAEVGDLVSASVEKEKAFEYGEAGVNALREIATALEKLKEGTYGKCERCGKPIGVKRLEAMPSARLCVACKLREEAASKIAPPPADNLFED
jgi:DnaK suppressor protein